MVAQHGGTRPLLSLVFQFLAALGEANLWRPSLVGKQHKLRAGPLGREHHPVAHCLCPRGWWHQWISDAKLGHQEPVFLSLACKASLRALPTPGRPRFHSCLVFPGAARVQDWAWKR